MRVDIFKREVLAKCDALKKSGLWVSEQTLRPKAWLNNFEEEDQGIAAFLLDQFVFYSNRYTDALLHSAYNKFGDVLDNKVSSELVEELSRARFTFVSGETPNPTDSGFYICRKLRQIFDISEEQFVEPGLALEHALDGGLVVFADDFVGSGDQFFKTWTRDYLGEFPSSFSHAALNDGFKCVYLAIAATQRGIDRIRRDTRGVQLAICHVLDERTSIHGMELGWLTKGDIDRFLEKYVDKLRPREEYIKNTREFIKYGYHRQALVLAFEHSVPDATLPIFWSPGIDGWVPLFERT